jgi:sigma-B regulation protein RsbU (phosphoserine phosphatase)
LFTPLYIPALEVGGDYYDVIPLSDGKLATIVADVTGHGIQAALSTTMLKSVFTEFTNQTSGPEAILRRMNAVLYRVLPADVFVAATVAVFTPGRNLVRVANGGGPHPFLLRRKDGRVEHVVTNGLLLGVVDSALFNPGEEVTIELSGGDGLLFYTDGLSEVENSSGAMFGEADLRHALVDASSKRGEELNEFLVHKARDFSVPGHAWDDITILNTELLGA